MSLGEVKGYYFFYEVDKVKGSKTDKDKRRYKLIITDPNLAELSNKTIVEDENLILSEGCYNGEYLAFKYYNFKDKEPYQKIKILDKDANLISSRTTKLDKKALFFIQSAQANEDADGTDLYPVPKKGFIDFMPIATKKTGSGSIGSQITFIPHTKGDSTNKGWIYKTKEEIFEIPDFINASSEVLYVAMGRKAKIKSKDADISLVAFDINTGNITFDKTYEDEKYVYQTLNLNYSTVKKEHTIFGNIYDIEKVASAKAESLGLFVSKIDDKGNELIKKQIFWDKFKDANKFKDEDGDESEIGNIYMHKLVSTKDGKLFAIGERFKKKLDGTSAALGGAAMLLGGGFSSASVSFNLVLQHMVVIEFDKDLNVKNVEFFDKGKNKIPLGIFGRLNINTLANIAKAFGWFDYSFTQEKKDKSGFVVGFSSSKEGEGLGTIVYNDGKLSQDKVVFSKKAKITRIYPGKFGYVMISEYFKKEKRITTRLEKVNM